MGLMRTFKQWKAFIHRFYFYRKVVCFILSLALLFTYLHIKKLLGQALLEQHNYKGDTLMSQNIKDVLSNTNRRNINLEKCEIFSLLSNIKPRQSENNIQPGCQRIPPLPGSCTTADQIFFSKPPASCSHQTAYNFCELQKSNDKWTVHCNETASRACESPLSIGTIHQQTGSLVWEEVGTQLQVSKKLTAAIQSSDYADMHVRYGFCFIRCALVPQDLNHNALFFNDYIGSNIYSEMYYDYAGEAKKNAYAQQLLVLPPQVKTATPKNKPFYKNAININVILVDSVSRQHFFRSLKKSVDALKRIKSSSHSIPTVFDFELVQAVQSRTFETLQTIFSGDIDPSKKPFDTQAIPPQPLKLSTLLSKYKAKGYHTLWLEDLCYLWEWGISKDLHFLNKSSSSKDTWVRMWQKLAESQLDSIGITLAMCKVLNANGIKDHFHGPDSVCFNGRHQHEYLIEYLLLYQQTMESLNQPYFTITMTNVAHEDTGRRVQTLDKALSQYLISSFHLQNTLTIILSDHGNTYGAFIEATDEANIELFNPFMFFIIPGTVATLLGDKAMKSLEVNTHRLVSVLDLHYSLNHIIALDLPSRFINGPFRVSSKGLFEPVEVNRTCDDIPRIMPNLCICQNYDKIISNDTEHNLFAYFALGQLNDEIQKQLWLSSSKNPHLTSGNIGESSVVFGKCEKLILSHVQNIRKSFTQDRSQILKMDLHVQQDQIFFVAVSIKYNETLGHHMAALEMYDRKTAYNKYATCTDNIDKTLCICDIPNIYRQHFISPADIPSGTQLVAMNLLPSFEMIVQNVSSIDNCILLVTIRHISGAVIFTANICKHKQFHVRAELEADKKIVYSLHSRQLRVQSGGLRFLGLIYSEAKENWSCSVKLQCQIIL